MMGPQNHLDMIGSVMFVGACAVIAVILYRMYRQLTENYNVMLPPGETEQTGLIDTPAPFSNAPVRGEPKGVIIPRVWDNAMIQRDANYTMSGEPVIRWDLIPMSARVVTLGFLMSNPPVTVDDPTFTQYVLSSVPAGAGITVGFNGRSRYKIEVGKSQHMDYVRDNTYWQPEMERVEIRFTQLDASHTRVELLYNGADKVITSEQHIPVSDIRAWPQKTKIFNTGKIQNVWVAYNK